MALSEPVDCDEVIWFDEHDFRLSFEDVRPSCEGRTSFERELKDTIMTNDETLQRASQKISPYLDPRWRDQSGDIIGGMLTEVQLSEFSKSEPQYWTEESTQTLVRKLNAAFATLVGAIRYQHDVDVPPKLTHYESFMDEIYNAQSEARIRLLRHACSCTVTNPASAPA